MSRDEDDLAAKHGLLAKQHTGQASHEERLDPERRRHLQHTAATIMEAEVLAIPLTLVKGSLALNEVRNCTA